ncbi:zwei Ig domain protein zig-8 isoform X2 [Drosophila teissieri]|nr:zwei Ig domain protein zig-8 isoform X2 [Drosophila teissieri]
MHSPHAEDWTLRIRYAQRKDSGIYECQISTTPPIGHSVYLNIVEPVTDIIGGPELHINRGSTINLTCIVKFAPEPPPTVIWSHNREIINFDSPRGGISLVTEKGVLTTSRLLVQKAITQDSGLYTCTPSNANPTSVRVHIVDGEHPAAMHTGNNGNSTATQPPVLLPLVLLTCGTLMLLQLVASCATLLPATPPGRRIVQHTSTSTFATEQASGQRSNRNCQDLQDLQESQDLRRRGVERSPVPGT